MTVYQRHLPHWRQEGATYFVTFRLADSLPQSKLQELDMIRKEWERRHNPRRTALQSRPAEWHAALEELARELHECVECCLDEGIGDCVLKQPSAAACATQAMHYFDALRYELGCYVVMPNHVHAIVRPLLTDHPLEKLIGGWKNYSARRINNQLRQQGTLWQEECYDRIIRDEEHLWRVIQYIGSNLKRAGLPRGSCPLWIKPEWVKLGWKFDG